MYSTADAVSSNTQNKEYSSDLVDQLLLNNGYDIRIIQRIKERGKKKKSSNKKRKGPTPLHVSTLKIPHLTDQCTAEIKRAAKQCFLPLRVVSTPGKRLGDILTSSRPLDKPQCPRNNSCRTCSRLLTATVSNVNCVTQNTVYEVKCGCGETYNGETGRPLHKRFNEHYRNANNPTAKSYINTPLAKHYREHHPDSTSPDLSVAVLERGRNTIHRKIKEARIIAKNKPTLNDKKELLELQQFLV